MKLSTGTLGLWLVSIGSTAAFSTSGRNIAFVSKSVASSVVTTSSSKTHPSGCGCNECARPLSVLFADVAEEVPTEVEATAEEVPAEVEATAEEVPAEVEATVEEVPAEVEAMDGVENSDEAHNVDRPARASLKKKRGPKGKDLSEFEVGSMVTGSVSTITNYGAFIDIGATTDGLLHISQLSTEFVGDVNDILTAGQEIEVRIVSIDSDKRQVALSLISAEEAENSQAGRRRERPQRQNNRRDDSAVLAALSKKGWEPTQFVEGTVVSTVDFGCFVRVDASLLNSECEGTFDGLVHISALASGRVSSVTDIASVDDKVQVRMKSMNGNKVSLTMLSVEDEESKMESSGGSGAPEGAKDWKESLEKFDNKMPVFKNGPLIVDTRN